MSPRAVVFRTALGWCAAAARDGRLFRTVLPCDTARAARHALAAPALRGPRAAHDPLLRCAAEAIIAYFAGERVSFDFPLDLDGATPFRRAVWCEVQRIPYGQVRTYGQIASALGRPQAARAVGLAMAANPLPIVIPCHRVVARNGLGGFMAGSARGTALKAAMLALEEHGCVAGAVSNAPSRRAAIP